MGTLAPHDSVLHNTIAPLLGQPPLKSRRKNGESNEHVLSSDSELALAEAAAYEFAVKLFNARVAAVAAAEPGTLAMRGTPGSSPPAKTSSEFNEACSQYGSWGLLRSWHR